MAVTSPLFSPMRAYDGLWGDSEYFGQPDDRPLSSEYLAVVQQRLASGWRMNRSGLWMMVEPASCALPAHGWKIHVSATLASAAAVLGRSVAICVEAGTPFKFIGDPTLLRLVNGKGFHRSAGGKFITVYPGDEASFRKVIDRLVTALADHAGPYILSDFRHPDSSCVFYRYGQIQPTFRRTGMGLAEPYIVDPDGNDFVDRRSVPARLPPWVSDPIASAAASGGEPAEFLADYRIESALAFSNAGGVYKGWSTRVDRAVVLKEARPHIICPSGHYTAPELLRREFDIVRSLDHPQIVRALDFGQAWEHSFAVYDYVVGEHLGVFANAHNPATTRNRHDWTAYLTSMREIWCQILQTVIHVHDRGVTLGDLSPSNVLISAEGLRDPTVHLIDLEAALRDHGDEDTHIYTYAFASPQRIDAQPLSRADDFYSLGAVLSATLGMGPQLGPYAAEVRGAYFALLRSVAPVRPAVLDALHDCLAPDPSGRPDASALLHEVDRGLIRRRGSGRTPRIGVVPDLHIRAWAEETVDGCVAEIIQRHARDPEILYPADTAARLTNGVCAAYGAAGVQRILAATGRRIPDAHAAWLLSRDLRDADLPAGLYTGLAGMGWALAEFGQEDLGRDLIDSAYTRAAAMSDDSVFAGRSGIGLALLFAWDRWAEARHLERAASFARKLATDDDGPSGYAFGATGHGLFLTELACRRPDDATREAAVRHVSADVRRLHMTAAGVGGLAWTMPSGTTRVSSYWVDGTAGLVTALSRLYGATGHPAVLTALTRVAADLDRQIVFQSGFFSGLAGIGNALIDAYQATLDRTQLDAAWRVAAALRPYRRATSAGLAFLGEQNIRLSLDFATGSAGVVAFLHRLLHADRCPSLDFVPSTAGCAVRGDWHLDDAEVVGLTLPDLERS